MKTSTNKNIIITLSLLIITCLVSHAEMNTTFSTSVTNPDVNEINPKKEAENSIGWERSERIYYSSRLNTLNRQALFSNQTAVSCERRMQDSLTLVQVYQDNGGINWNTQWDFEQPLHTWVGVTATEFGCVEKLNLIFFGMTGFFPQLTQLQDLEELLLDANNLEGFISTNRLTGFNKLRRLSIQSNNFNGMAAAIGDVSNLEELAIGNNDFTALPSEIGNLANLQILNVGNNQLTSLPTTIGSLPNLEELIAFRNDIIGSFPIHLLNLSSLKILILENNQLSGSLPSNFNQLSNLEELNLQRNNLSGGIPATIGDLTTLKTLHLSDNQLSGSIPNTIGNLIELEIFWIARNETISGSIPNELGNLTKLSSMNISDNNLSGTIPASFDQLNQLGFFDAQRNNLTGNIATVLNDLEGTPLVTLNLSTNNFTGNIPMTIDQITNLRSLNLSANQISGTLPTTLGNLTNLSTLCISNNRFTGAVPSTLGQLTGLKTLCLAANQFDDVLPSELGNLTNLESLFLGNYNGDGNESLRQKTNLSLPLWVGNLAKLTFLDLQHAGFTGTIPESYGDLANLNFLFLQKNDLSGCIPSSLNNHCSLNSFDLANNAKLPWQGDTDQFCATPNNQIGAPCDDGNPNTSNDQINADCNCVGNTSGLAVDLIDFTAQLDKNNQAQLYWRVANEIDIIQYNVQRSTDGINWQNIGVVNAIQQTNYTFLDKNAVQQNIARLYYRLEIVEIAGRSEFSALRQIMLGVENTFTLYPNPATKQITLSFSQVQKLSGAIELLNVQGLTQRRFPLVENVEQQQLQLDINQLPTGIYWLKIPLREQLIMKKVAIQR